MSIGITFGTWDLFHYGHLRFLKRACCKVNWLYVGVCSDELNLTLKGEYPVINEKQRLEIVKKSRYVDYGFIYRSTDYVSRFKKYGCHVLLVGEEFGKQGVAEHDVALKLPYKRITRTKDINSTIIKERIINANRK